MNEMKQEFERIIKELFPGKQYQHETNFDDMNEGFDIGLDIGVMGRIRYPMQGGSYWVLFEVWKIQSWNDEVKHKHVFKGDLPANEMKEPDFDFITNVLKNWKLFTF